MKKREANFELLRIAAMLMIITLHYLDKGGILRGPQEPLSPAGCLAWGLEAFCVCSVNVYVLISAYFLAESDYRPMKMVTLWLQVFFYSAGIAAVLTLAGIVPLSQRGPYDVMNYMFPVIEEHYWFVTAYMFMFLLAPLMNGTLRALPEKTYRQGIVLLGLLLSVSKSVLPVTLPTDRLGYDALWFLFLYVVGVYLRRHGRAVRFAIAGYAVCSGFIFASLLAVHAFYMRTGSLADFVNRQYQYNSVPCLLASVFFFLAFRNIRIPDGKAAAVICRVASASFGVYLIHEHIDVRYRWPKWLGAERFADTPLFLLHWIVSAAAVYAVCMAIEFGRQLLWRFLGKCAHKIFIKS